MRERPMQKHRREREKNNPDERRQHAPEPRKARLGMAPAAAAYALFSGHAPSARRMLARIRVASPWYSPSK